MKYYITFINETFSTSWKYTALVKYNPLRENEKEKYLLRTKENHLIIKLKNRKLRLRKLNLCGNKWQRRNFFHFMENKRIFQFFYFHLEVP